VQLRRQQNPTAMARGRSPFALASVISLCLALLILPGTAAAQCISPFTVQSVSTRGADNRDKTAFGPGEPMLFVGQLSNLYGGSGQTYVAIETSFLNNNQSVDLPIGVSAHTWNAAAPLAPDSYAVTVKILDTFCGMWQERSTTFTVTPLQNQLPPQIVRTETFTEGVLVYFKIFFTDPNNNAAGFGFRGIENSGWAPETHPFASPSYGRVSLSVSPATVEYPFNLGCGTASQYESNVEAWIYDSVGLNSQPVTIHLACQNTLPIAQTFTYPVNPSEAAWHNDYNVHTNLPNDWARCYNVPFNRPYHAGQDYGFPASAAANLPVFAVGSGVVRYSSKDPGTTKTYPGGVVIIEHKLSNGESIFSMYAHLDPNKILVSASPPTMVTKGQSIATGLIPQVTSFDNTHLHWEMRYFYDGSEIKAAPDYTATCSGIPGPGYTYPEEPDNFQGIVGKTPDGTPTYKSYHWTDPRDFVDVHK